MTTATPGLGGEYGPEPEPATIGGYEPIQYSVPYVFDPNRNHVFFDNGPGAIPAGPRYPNQTTGLNPIDPDNQDWDPDYAPEPEHPVGDDDEYGATPPVPPVPPS